MPAAAAGLVLFATVVNPAVVEHAKIRESDLKALNPANVNWFDRPVISNPVGGYARALKHSDLLLNASILSPALLALDKRIRKDWLDLLSMYMLTHAINNTIYVSTVGLVRRTRPLVYNPDLPLEHRIGKNKTNSFYSGHVSNAAASTFFIVKVLTDYHEIKGWPRILLYGAAAVPPALVGHYRIQAGRHFRTDVITGLVVGAASGIMVPELHRRKSKRMSITPYYSSSASGIAISVRIGDS
jgi:membrane-associated phospholipid phosphatase